MLLVLDYKKWHPDRWIKDPKLALEAKKRFQHIQEAYSGVFFIFVNNLIIYLKQVLYSNEAVNIDGLCFAFFPFLILVLSDKGKRRIYDAGLFGLIAEDDDDVGFSFYIFH